MQRSLGRRGIAGVLGAGALSCIAIGAGVSQASGAEEALSPLRIEARSMGWNEKDQEVMTGMVMALPEVATRLKRDRFRILSSEFGEADALPQKLRAQGIHLPVASDEFKLTIFDYTQNRLLEISGRLSRTDKIRIRDLNSDQAPQPTPEEYEEAYRIIQRDEYFGAESLRGKFELYEPMPGLIRSNERDDPGSLQRAHDRVLAVGLFPKDPSFVHEIVGVDLSDGRVIRYEHKAPPTVIADERACGPKNSGQRTTRRGTWGAAQMVVRDSAGQELWSWTVVRPASSSGSEGSGIDLRDVSYRGKKVLSQIHTPILNVNYDRNLCGPYRDWGYAEHPFTAEGSLIAPGILQASKMPETIMDTDEDHGNFRGVAAYARGDEVILVSEMASGFYRYVSEYRFKADGTLQPSWGFAAVQDSCTCHVHHHHAYWRMDFDIQGESLNTVQVRDGAEWKTVSREAMQNRDGHHQGWRVINPKTGAGYEVIPGEADGTADQDSYGRGDVWLLKWRQNEIDDSQVQSATRAALRKFVSGERIEDRDAVLWYAGHFDHRPEPSRNLREEHRVGPTLKPVQW